MKAQNDEHKDKRMSLLLSAVDHRANEPDRQFLDKLKEQSTAEFLAFSTDGNKQSEKTIPISIWRIIMKSKIKYKVALIGCVIIVSVTAAMTGPSVYHTIRAFLFSLDEKRIPELVELADPMSAVPHQIKDIHNLLTESELKLVSLYADNNYAIAVTTDIVVMDKVYDQGRNEGPLVITLVKRDNVWLVTDIDLETEDTVKIELDRFIKRHPDAVEITTRSSVH